MHGRIGKRRIGTMLGLLVLAATLAGCNSQNGSAASAVGDTKLRNVIDNAYQEVFPSIVRIHVVVTAPGSGRIMKFQASGSGAIISPDGYVVTNHHVAGKATRIICRLADRQEISAELIGTDPMTDIAVLKLNLDERKDPNAPVPVAKFGNSDNVAVGDTVLAMGSPAGLSQSVTAGVVSNTEMISSYGGMTLDGENVGLLVRWIGHDAHIYHGNSGGPLVNLRGEIVGINEVGIGGLGGAIPANLAQSVARQLIEGGGVKRSWTGINAQPLLRGSGRDTGVLVGGVINDSPADKAKLKPGDIITEFDGRAVTATVAEELPLFYQVVLSTPVEETVDLTIYREGTHEVLQLTTVARERAVGDDVELREWGITVRDFTMMSALQRNRPSKDGVLVYSLRPGAPAGDAKPAIRSGDVIVAVGDKPVNNVSDMQAITRTVVKGKDEPVPTLVSYERGSEKLMTVVNVGMEPERAPPRRARKAWLAVKTQVLTRDLAEALDLEGTTGFRVTHVYKGYSAEEAGLEVGDLIVRLDGMKIDASQPEDSDVLDHMIRQYKIGATPELTILRDGEKKKLPVKLDMPPTPIIELATYKDEEFEFEARDLSEEDRVDKKLEKTVRGVLIQDVKRAGWAALAGLDTGDVLLQVNSKSLSSVDDLTEIMTGIRKQKPERVVLFIRRGIRTRYLVLEPDWDSQ
ncbi:MAG: PDZ domain-containing protein [Phycisphaerae bacterium]